MPTRAGWAARRLRARRARLRAPGYGGGGGGGGFMSSMFGGIGGALAGNWLYDQFSGRPSRRGSVDQSSYDPAVGGRRRARQ